MSEQSGILDFSASHYLIEGGEEVVAADVETPKQASVDKPLREFDKSSFAEFLVGCVDSSGS
jgi:hypothetical protein